MNATSIRVNAFIGLHERSVPATICVPCTPDAPWTTNMCDRSLIHSSTLEPALMDHPTSRLACRNIYTLEGWIAASMARFWNNAIDTYKKNALIHVRLLPLLTWPFFRTSSFWSWFALVGAYNLPRSQSH